MPYTIAVTPRAEREVMISKRLEASTDFGAEIFDFRGGTYTPKSVRLPVDLPVYRMENCRTFSKQQTAIAQRSLGKNFFARGQESAEAQQIQHEILVSSQSKGPSPSRRSPQFCKTRVSANRC